MRLVLPAIALLAVLPARADRVDRYVEAEMARRHLPALSLAIVRDGRVVKARGYGLADLEQRVPATAETVYEIGSVTKAFTAAAVLLLVEEGKVGLDDAVSKYFPDAPASWSALTVRHLLHHTSGIRNHVAVPGWLASFRTNLFGETTPLPDDLLKRFFELPLEFEPGTSWAYDNTGYHLLGRIVEKASGTSYWRFVDARVLAPLGMTATRSTDAAPIVPGRASGYGWTGEGYENRPALPPEVGFAAGSILSTVGDLARWDAALRGGTLLGRSSLEAMQTPARGTAGETLPFDYGFGFFVDSFRGHRVVQHSGGTPGFSSTLYRFPDDGLTVILLANAGDRILDPLAIEIAGLVVPGLKRPSALFDADPGTTERHRDVFAALLEGRTDSAPFTPPMRRFLASATGKGLTSWYGEHGALGDFRLADEESRGGDRVRRYRVELGGNAYGFSFRVQPDGTIVQLLPW